MRKIFTLVTMALMALAVNATTFTDNLVVSVYGQTVEMPNTVVEVNEAEGSNDLYNITLKNFTFQLNATSAIPLGDIAIDNVKGTTYGTGLTKFDETQKDITITLGNASVTLKKGSAMKGDKLYLDLAIVALNDLTVGATFGNDNFSLEYTDDLTVTAMGSTMPTQKATINATKQADGKYTLSLKNFTLGEGENVIMSVGTVEMKDIDATVDENGTIKLSTSQTVTIQAGDDPNVTWSLEGVPVDVKMTGELTDDKLLAHILIHYVMIPGTFEMDIDVAFGYDAAGITNVTTPNASGVDEIYDLSGRKLNELQKGINIVRKADGTTVKVLKR